jgi:uncharacterized membrane protein
MDEVVQEGPRISGAERAGDGAAERPGASGGGPGGQAGRAASDAPGGAERSAAPRVGPLSQERLAAFSDGVFAVAITLLVFGIPLPKSKAGALAQALLDQWPSYAAYGISFLTIGIIWVNHHGTFARVARIDRPLLFINLLFLMTVCFIPFPTSLLSLYVARGGADATASAFTYAATMTAMSVAFSSLWVYTIRRRLLHPEHLEHLSPYRMRIVIVRFAGGGLIYAACMGLAFVSPILDLVLFALLALYYVFDQQG